MSFGQVDFHPGKSNHVDKGQWASAISTDLKPSADCFVDGAVRINQEDNSELRANLTCSY